MSHDAATLYALLPAIYRIRDHAQGEPLKALLAVIAEQVAIVEDDLDQLYDDQFIETCAEWVAPYIGDLIGYRSLHGVAPKIDSPRAEVANTIRYRRRKGTASMLEQLARDVTGWDARVVEFFEQLGWNQYMNHTRVDPARGGTLDLRDHDACERTSAARGAFDDAAHTIDVRSTSSSELGRYNIPNIGLFLWRLRPYTVTDSDARKIAARQFTFNPLGLDAPLFNQPLEEEEITHIAEEINVAHELRRRVLYDELEARRLTLAMNRRPDGAYFGASPVFSVALDGARLTPEEIVICRLDDWQRPSTPKRYILPDGSTVTRKIRAAVDPVLGRLTVPSTESARHVTVSCAYGFSHEMGGGPYDRRESVAPELQDLNFHAVVSQELPAVANQVFATLTDAVAAWNAHCAASSDPPPAGVIAILDNRSYNESLTAADRITIPDQGRLIVLGAQWPEVVPSPPGPKRRVVDHIAPVRTRPHIAGDLSVVGTAAGPATKPGRLVLNGLLIEGFIRVLMGNLGGIELIHCTVVPGAGELEVAASATDHDRANGRLVVKVDHSICGPVRLPDAAQTLVIASSILSNGAEPDDAAVTIDARSADITVEQTTVFGRVAARSISASNSIFTGAIDSTRRQFGCLRFSYAPLESVVPRRFRCQPDLEIATRIERAERRAGGPLGIADRNAIANGTAAAVHPNFSAVRYGLPAYAQLREGSAIQLRTGADNEAEMGAFHDLHQPQREANLRVRLEEYLRAGLQAHIIYVS